MNTAEQWLVNYYDPHGSLNTVEAVLTQRQQLVESAETPTKHIMLANEVVAAETIHVGVELTESRLRTLGLVGISGAEILQSVEKEVDHDVMAVMAAVEELKNNHPPARDIPDMVLAGMVSAEWSHLGVKRKNGKDYYTHPARVAQVLETAWRLRVPYGQEEERLERLLFISYNHDTFEDSLRSDNGSFLVSRPFLVSPLFVEKLFNAYGRSDGKAAAEAILVLSKTKHISGGVSLERYIRAVQRNPDANLAKLADIQHNNKLDPKGLSDVKKIDTDKNRKRAENYEYIQARLLSVLENGSSLERWVGHTIPAITTEMLNRTEHGAVSIRPKLFISAPDQIAL